MKLEAIEVVEDHTETSRCDQGFLRVARLEVRNLYSDGTRSATYACDVVSRPGSDAVVAVLFEIDGERRIHVLLRDSTRPPVYLRKLKQFVHPDPRVYLHIYCHSLTYDGYADYGEERRGLVRSPGIHL